MTDATIEQMKHDLLDARKARDQLTVAALQSVLARITNAEAVAIPDTGMPMLVGVGAAEVARKELTGAEIQTLIHDEIAELHAAKESMADHADHPYAVELDQKIALLSRYVDSSKN
ncbi:MAG TPA: hypothetical protein VJ843_02145 [Candidatus Saccharimonadales bacterium]|nr:hypothetical protein [Candidatus Saccharimonadales bacterium]